MERTARGGRALRDDERGLNLKGEVRLVAKGVEVSLTCLVCGSVGACARRCEAAIVARGFWKWECQCVCGRVHVITVMVSAAKF